MVRSMLNRRTPHRVSRVVALMMLLAFVCRAFIPMGYMPASPTAKHDIPSLTFCLANGSFKTIALEQGAVDSDTPSGHGQSASGSCSFALLAGQTLFPPADIAFSADLSTDVAFVAFETRDIGAPLSRGPPLGSRAPPSLA